MVNNNKHTSNHRPHVVPKDTRLPPPPPGVRYINVWLLGIVISDDDLRYKVDHHFHWPMIILAVAILPLLIIEFTVLQDPTDNNGNTKPTEIASLSESEPVYNPDLAQKTALDKQHFLIQWAVWIAGSVIWLAFFMEYLIKVAIAESRIEYTKRNWLDIVIILLPFLRVFRIARLARTSRVFRLRGVGMKVAKYFFTIIIGMEASDRLLHRIGIKPKTKRKDPNAMTRHELITEIKKSRRLGDAWDKWHDEHDKYVKEHGGSCYIAGKPQLRKNNDSDISDITADVDLDSDSSSSGSRYGDGNGTISTS